MENHSGKEGFAVIGMACRFPQANSVEEYWNILENGLNTSSSLPPDRLQLTPINPQAKGNFLKCSVDQFDASFFGISPNEAVFTDPQTRLLLEVSWEAFEDAGLNPDKLVGSQTGVFYGSWLQDYKELMNKETESEQDFLRKYLGNGFGCTSSKLSLFYRWKGPNIATESGCSSSMMAVHLACQSLKSGECSLAIAAGANIILQWTQQDLTMWAKDGKSKAFDKDANGYGRGEAVGVLILKRLSQALKDGDRIHGIILGSAASQEGLSSSFGTPTAACEISAMKAALNNAGIYPNQVDYVEAHGTGTLVGDPTEASAINEAYASIGKEREAPLLIGSGKTNIGHTESSSGLAGIIKVILSMKNEIIPPHINLKNINPKINFDKIPGKIPMKLTSWKRDPNRPRIAGISSFGITGTDVHLILQEPPIADTELDIQQFKNEFISNIITISGKNSKALNQATVLLENFLKESKENLGDIAYSANACRTHHQFRRILIGIEKLEILTKIHNENWKTGSVRKEKPKICFTFSGLVGDINFEPAKILYDTCPTFRMQMDHCNTISCEVVIVSIMEIMAGKLNRPATAKEFYFFSLSVQLSLSKLWENWGIKPNAVMGHSVGEISAAVVSGVIDFGAALKMLNKMIIPPEGANPSTFMMAINASPDLTTELLNEFKEKECNQRNWVEISARNSKFQTVVTGKIGGFQGFKKFCEEKGVKCKNLNYGAFGFPLHSTAMKEYLPTGWNIGDQHQPPNITYISSVTGTQLEKLPINYWQELFISPVNYISACKASKDGGSNVYLEIGLGRPLTKLTEENIIQDSNTMFLSSLTGKGEKIWEGLLNTLGSLHVEGIQINWDNFYEHASKRKVSLPHYPFQRQSYWFKKNPNSQNSQGIHSKNNSNPKDHPLLGCYLPLAGGFSSEVTIFQNEMSSIDPYFLKDHCIGNSVIFPAAAFLEMILSAGKLTKTNEKQNISNDNHISVEDFIVHSPLHLKQEGNLIFQTIVEKASSQISVYSSYPSKSNLKSSWTLQASATIKIEKNERPIPADPPKKLELDVDFDAEEVVKFYDRHSKLGLNFGTEFRSLKKVLFGNDDELIALVNLPEQEEKKKEYLIHPILLDSMIQSFLFHSNPNFGKLRVPVRIKNICVFTRIESKTQNDIPLFLHCKADELTSQTTQVSLIDGNGNLLCIMRNPEFVATSVNAILRAAGVEERDQNEKGMPNLYKILWKKSNYLSNKSLKMDSFGPQTKNLWLVLQNGENNLIENLFSKIETVVENIKVISQVVDDNQKIEPILEQNKRNLEHIFYVVTSKQMENQDQRSFLEPLLNILQFLLKSKLPTLPKLYVVTSNAWNIGDERKFLEITPSSASLWGFVRSARLEIPGLQTKLIDLENFNELSEYAANQLLQEVLVNDKESEVAYRNENRFVRRMEELSHKNKNSLVSFPLSERFIVEVPKSKMISDLRYIPNNAKDSQKDLKLEATQIQIAIRSTSLNFRDVLIIMKPASVFEEMNTIGSDYAGIVTGIGESVRKFKVGDLVYGISMKNSTIASHITAEEYLAAKLPENLTFSEGATLPVVFFTAWHCIVNLAKLTRDQTILIHAASGGVGLMAIQIAKNLGLRVIGTAGNNLKQEFLKKLGIQHVFGSRNLEFGEEIKKITKGEGVDMVLNCLTGPGFKETSLEICKIGGHFIEISKLDVWTEKEVEERRPDVHYHFVNLPDVHPQILKKMFDKLTELLEQGTIKPLIYTRFLASNVVDAFHYLQKAKQIGKVIVDMPQEIEANHYEEKLFNARSSYLITGGRGAIGLAIGKWMANQGAKHLILVGRSEPTPEVLEAIKAIENDGVKIYSEQEDISDFEKCREFIKRLEKNEKIPPLRGIHHCAGVLEDRMILQQNWENFEFVFKPKVKGVFYLHTLTLDYPMEFFVVHSSISSTLGNIGQSNYAAANAYMDSLIEMRVNNGLKGKSINWGQWDAGMGEGLQLQFARAFPIHQGISTLQKLFEENQTSMVAGNVNFSWLTRTFPNYETTLLENISWREEKEEGNEGGEITKIPVQQKKFFIETYNALQNESDKMEAIEKFVARIVKDTLGLRDCETIERNRLFSEMGMDSIMSIEFLNRLKADVYHEFLLGFVHMEESGTVDQISQLLNNRLSSQRI